jgi:hypothetical protein
MNSMHAWMDIFRPHFASADGSYFKWKSHQLEAKKRVNNTSDDKKKIKEDL